MDIEDVLCVLVECETSLGLSNVEGKEALAPRIREAYKVLSVWVAKDRIATQREERNRALRLQGILKWGESGPQTLEDFSLVASL